MRGKFLRDRPRLLPAALANIFESRTMTCDLFAVANLARTIRRENLVMFDCLVVNS